MAGLWSDAPGLLGAHPVGKPSWRELFYRDTNGLFRSYRQQGGWKASKRLIRDAVGGEILPAKVQLR